MGERPIVMTTSSVRAILEDRKLQTRRVMKPQPYFSHDNWWFEKKGMVYALPNGKELCTPALGIWDVCPYGRAGDRLWVKETWRVVNTFDGLSPSEMASRFDEGKTASVWYRYPVWMCNDKEYEKNFQGRWRSARFMPRWASRFLLEIKGIRIERVQDITLEDIEKEGVIDDEYKDYERKMLSLPEGYPVISRRAEFVQLWDSINLKRGYGYDANPWVWVIDFKVVKS